jgi:hypothetical protein
MVDADRYAITVRRVEVDGELLYRGTVREFPDVAVYENSREEAFGGVLSVIDALRELAEEDGRPFPTPIEDEEQFTGRITLRMPPTLHKKLAEFADAEDASLNQYIVQILTAAVATALVPSEVWGRASSAVISKTGTVLGGFRAAPYMSFIERFGKSIALYHGSDDDDHLTKWTVHSSGLPVSIGQMQQPNTWVELSVQKAKTGSARVPSIAGYKFAKLKRHNSNEKERRQAR